MNDRTALYARIAALIDGLADGSRDDARRDALLLDLARYQAARIPAYGNLVRARTTQLQTGVAPALPTDAFRFTRVCSRPEADEVRRFVSSGTTQEERSEHPMADLSLYDRAARAAARYALFPDHKRIPLVLLAPTASGAPQSSLSYMLGRFADWFGCGKTCVVWRDDRLQARELCERLEAAQASTEPIALLGTAFAFVHALDALSPRRFRLPQGSRVMFTGGFKGRAREVAPETLRARLSHMLGVPDAWLVGEYGMTELSSQMYDLTLRKAALNDLERPNRPMNNSVGEEVPPPERSLWAPGWLRVTLVDGDGLNEVAPFEEGLIRVDDPANLDSVSAIQTADIGRKQGKGFVVLGRAALASPRGCSLSFEGSGSTGGSP